MQASSPTQSPTSSPSRSPTRKSVYIPNRFECVNDTLANLTVSQKDAIPGQQRMGRQTRSNEKRDQEDVAHFPRSTSRDIHDAYSVRGIGGSSQECSLDPCHHGTRVSVDKPSLIDLLQVAFVGYEAMYFCKPTTPEPKSTRDGNDNSSERDTSPIRSPWSENVKDEVDDIEMRLGGVQHLYHPTLEYENTRMRMLFRRSGFCFLLFLKLVIAVAFVLHLVLLGHSSSSMGTFDLGNLTGTNSNAGGHSSSDNNTEASLIFSNGRKGTPRKNFTGSAAKHMPIEGVDPGFGNPRTNETHLIPIPPDNLALLCSGEMDFMACAGVCNEAACCWQVGIDSCFKDGHGSECRPYTRACSVLNLPNEEIIDQVSKPKAARQQQSSGPQFVPSPLADIETVCKRQRLVLPTTQEPDIEAIAICKWACLPGECCWREEATTEQCLDNPHCETYMAYCSLLVDLEDYAI